MVAEHTTRVNFLLPQDQPGTVRRVTPVDIHGDRYVDLLVAFDGEPDAPRGGRVSAAEVPSGLEPGDRVSVRFVMGVMVGVSRA